MSGWSCVPAGLRISDIDSAVRCPASVFVLSGYTSRRFARQSAQTPRLRYSRTSIVDSQNVHVASSLRRTMPPFSTVMASSSPSWMLKSRLVSAGTTIRPRSSIFLTMRVSKASAPFDGVADFLLQAYRLVGPQWQVREVADVAATTRSAAPVASPHVG